MSPAANTNSQSTQDKPDTPLLSALQVKRAIRHGAEAYLVLVSCVTDTDQGTNVQFNSAIPAKSQDAKFDAKLQAMLTKFKHVFPSELPYFDPVDTAINHTIPTLPGAKAPCGPIYRLSQPEMEELKKQIAELLLKGYIEPSTSPYGAPVLFVRKKDGSLRMCVDYRALNKITIKNKYPLPRIDDLLDRLNGSTCFSSIDLKSGYYQIPIHEEDIPKSAFRTQLGHFQWRCTVMGLTNSPSSFQNIMNNIFREYLNDFVLVYLDDILIFSRTPEEHLRHLELVLKKLEEYKLSAHLKKCQFGKSHLDFLGHVIGADGIRVDPKKVAPSCKIGPCLKMSRTCDHFSDLQITSDAS
jgi:Reverse transcriptase (RNA-dependent DNA polymerase)